MGRIPQPWQTYCRTIHNNEEEEETTKVFLSRCVVKENVVYMDDEILFIHKRDKILFQRTGHFYVKLNANDRYTNIAFLMWEKPYSKADRALSTNLQATERTAYRLDPISHHQKDTVLPWPTALPNPIHIKILLMAILSPQLQKII